MVSTILISNSETVVFNIPQDYIGKEIEIIVFSKEECLLNNTVVQKQASFNAISIDIKNFNLIETRQMNDKIQQK